MSLKADWYEADVVDHNRQGTDVDKGPCGCPARGDGDAAGMGDTDKRTGRLLGIVILPVVGLVLAGVAWHMIAAGQITVTHRMGKTDSMESNRTITDASSPVEFRSIIGGMITMSVVCLYAAARIGLAMKRGRAEERRLAETKMPERQEMAKRF